MDDFVCPICGKSEKCTKQLTTNSYNIIRCENGYSFGIDDDIFSESKEKRDKIFNLVFEHLLQNPMCEKKYWYFFCDSNYQIKESDEPQYVNLANALQTYPSNIIEQANRSLLNLSILHPRYGDIIGLDYIDIHAIYIIEDDLDDEANGFLKLMVELGYLVEDKSLFKISANGWKKIEELKMKRQEINQGFIAMRFSDETKDIREAFRKAINDSGFAVKIIDEKEHNNQIVPEIFYEIERSKFVVVDVTYPNYGAYYEAGYAQGMGKQVIVCCKKEVFENKEGKYDRPHFDISQKSMVIWDDNEDLVRRLQRRIQATVK